jgi:predicted HD superfamily hydrolase involved in NAD metabolism
LEAEKMEFKRLLTQIELVLSPRRFLHTKGVLDWAEKMADRHQLNQEQVRPAALLHDCAKKLPAEALLNLAEQAGISLDKVLREQPFLLHGPVGAVLAKQHYHIQDLQVLQAISRHTLGADEMTPLDKLIFLADMVEINRSYPGVAELRALTLVDMDQAMLAALDQTIKLLLDRQALIHPQTISTRNSILRSLTDQESSF